MSWWRPQKTCFNQGVPGLGRLFPRPATCLIATWLSLATLPLPAQGPELRPGPQPRQPYSQQEVDWMLDHHTPWIESLVRNRHIKFEVTPEVEKDLKKHHASAEFISFLKQFQPPPPQATPKVVEQAPKTTSSSSAAVAVTSARGPERERVSVLRKVTPKPSTPAASTPTAQSSPVGPASGTVTQNRKDGLQYVWIPPGGFQIGCSPRDNDCGPFEKPAHQVTITKGFWLGQTDVTVQAYGRYVKEVGKTMPPEPIFLSRPLNSGWNNGAMPIVDVTWAEARDYCTWAEGRLPTEAEWEYAARGGSTDARYGPLDEIAWYAVNSGRQRLDSAELYKDDQQHYTQRLKENGNGIHEVAQKRPNGFGLFDMLGNVRVWVNDWEISVGQYPKASRDPTGPTSGEYRILRGASWFDGPWDVRASTRTWGDLSLQDTHIGLRCARAADGP